MENLRLIQLRSKIDTLSGGINDITKYNHNRDSKGRFATSDSAVLESDPIQAESPNEEHSANYTEALKWVSRALTVAEVAGTVIPAGIGIKAAITAFRVMGPGARAVEAGIQAFIAASSAHLVLTTAVSALKSAVDALISIRESEISKAITDPILSYLKQVKRQLELYKPGKKA
jgi:hypothetical protein